MCINLNSFHLYRQSGVSLVEAIIFVVVVSVGVVGLMGVMNSTVKHSADPMLQKQAVAIAESLLEEIMAQPFTDCDPDAYDVNTGICTTAETMGPETISGVTETRYSLDHPFDNVNDNDGFKMLAGIRSITNGATVVAGLSSYTASVAITPAGADFPSAVPAADALRIDVTVSNPIGEVLTLTGYRLRYAPTAMP